jgi:general secretion pathway protein D
MDFLIQFLRKTTDARILAEPQINIRDNETGRLFVGQQVPIQTSAQNQGSIGTSQNFEYKDVGVILEVTPHINNTGDVELKIHAESSVVVPGETILGGAVFDTRNFRTDLTAKNGQSLVLGGIIQKQITDTLYKTPILGDIPGLKWLFNKKDKSSHEVELMVFLRPKVTRTPQDAKDLMNEIYEKAPNVKKWKDELHQKKDANPPQDPPAK